MLTQISREAHVQEVSNLIVSGRRHSNVDIHRIWWELLQWAESTKLESRIKNKSAQVFVVSWKWKKPPREICIGEGRSIVWMWKGYVIVHNEHTEETTCMNYKHTEWWENEIMVLLDTEH